MNNSDRKLIIPRPRLPSPSSPINQSQNRFIALTPYPPSQISPVTRPPYSVLAKLQGLPPSPNPFNKTTTSNKTEFHFHPNPNTQIIKILEPSEEQKLNQNFSVLLDYLFPTGTIFYKNDFQIREYYEAILKDSQSVQIRHTYNKDDARKIDFSKVKIIKVISEKDWGTRLFINKTLSGYPDYPAYNYYDYIEAWDKAFLFKAHYHTWFFHFNEEFSLNYPRWFVKWFKNMGQIPECFPTKVLAGFNQYKSMFKQDGAPPFEYTLQFSALFKLPWILSFTYKKKDAEGVSPPLLVRQYNVKWWKQINEDQADKETVIKYYNSLFSQSPSSSSATSASRLSKTNDEFARKMQECKSDEEFEQLINQRKNSPTPSEDIFQDSQDPYDGVDLNM